MGPITHFGGAGARCKTWTHPHANREMSDPPTTAFVLSGGASLGAVQAGMLRILYERGVAPDLIVGASVGALNGAFIADSQPRSERTTAADLGV